MFQNTGFPDGICNCSGILQSSYSGIIASNTIRAVVELAGIKDIMGKSLGSSNRINVIKATMLGLASLRKREKSVIEDTAAPETAEEVNETA